MAEATRRGRRPGRPWSWLVAALGAGAALGVAPRGAPAAAPPPPTGVVPGGVVRWTAPGTLGCSLGGREWAPAGDTCFYPVDLLRTGTFAVARLRDGRREEARLKVLPYPYAVQRLTVDERHVKLSAEDLARVERERAKVQALFRGAGAARFALPLGAPLAKLSGGTRFGARRFFNGQPRSPHSGVDYAASTGTQVRSTDGGSVVLAEEHFFSGLSVFVDHGGGLVSMYFHLSRIQVKEGEEVKRGQPLGEVGSTGRVTGPHLHFALNWHGARVDPRLLLGAPDRIPEIRP